MINDFVTTSDVRTLFRPLTVEEEQRAEALIPVVASSLRVEAKKVGRDLDKMAQNDADYLNVVRSVMVDVVARTLMTSTDQEPMVSFSEGALGYTQSGTFLSPGGGLFIKNSELARLGLRRQRYGVLEPYAY